MKKKKLLKLVVSLVLICSLAFQFNIGIASADYVNWNIYYNSAEPTGSQDPQKTYWKDSTRPDLHAYVYSVSRNATVNVTVDTYIYDSHGGKIYTPRINSGFGPSGGSSQYNIGSAAQHLKMHAYFYTHGNGVNTSNGRFLY